uniref:Uncharacterized protein n=1 Tax=Alexandrium monilatum TaxID=311494 RepID=A0A7S4VIN1_9DINO
MATRGVAPAQAGTVRLGTHGLAHGELASLVADAEREPSEPAVAAPGSSRVLRVEVNGLLHDWFDVDEMGDFVRSTAFAGTLRENVARYFGVPLEKQAIYDEDGLLTTSADFSRALQRVSPKLYVYDVYQMGQELRERTVEELEAIDAEVEQSWRHFGAYNSRSRQASASTLSGPPLLPEKSLDMGERGDKVGGGGPCLEQGSAEGDRGGTSGSGWQPAAEQAPMQPQLLPAAVPPAAPPVQQLPAQSLLPAAQQRRSGSVVSLTPAHPSVGPEHRGRGTADFGSDKPVMAHMNQAGDDHQAFSLFAPTAATAPAPSAPAHAPAGLPPTAAQAEPLVAHLRGGVRVLSAGQGKAAQLMESTIGPDVTNAALLNSSGSSRTLAGDASPVQPAPRQALAQQVTPRCAAGTISGAGGCLRAAPVVQETRRPEPCAAEVVPMVMSNASTTPQRHQHQASAPAPATSASMSLARATSRERVGAAASAGQSMQVLRRTPSQRLVEGSHSPRAATPPRVVTPVAVTPRLATSSRRRSTTPVPVTVSPVWGQRAVQPQPLAPQAWAPAPWPGTATPPRSITPRRSMTPSRREVPVQSLQGMALGGPAAMALPSTLRSVTPGLVATAAPAAWRHSAMVAPNASMSLCEWSQVYQH